MLWIKTFHILFVISWFAGLFYLPRIFVNLAQENSASAHEILILMARRLYRFMTLLAIPAVGFGIILWLGYGIGQNQYWLYSKLAIVILIIGYHHACGRLLQKFIAGKNTYSHRWYRWFNEIPVFLLFAAIAFVVIKPF